MKILFVSVNGIKDSEYGGPKGSIRNYKALTEFGKVDVYTIKKISNFKSLMSLLKGFYPPINSNDLKKLHALNQYKYDLVFFDGSIYGNLVDLFPESKKIVFYHNCEQDYNVVRFGTSFSLKKYMYQWLINRNEKYITNQSDYRIAFSIRDSNRIKELYGKVADAIIPLGIEDKFTGMESRDASRYCLLLGTICAANIEGYKWFVENVSPYLNCKTIIAGRGFEKYKLLWENEKVKIIGYVNELEKIYVNASCVAIPLFSGGGMKVKTAEALMFGKTIFGTDEAFSGYDFLSDGVAYQCNTGNEFIYKINFYLETNNVKFNKSARDIYLNHYSLTSAKKIFENIIASLDLGDKI